MRKGFQAEGLLVLELILRFSVIPSLRQYFLLRGYEGSQSLLLLTVRRVCRCCFWLRRFLPSLIVGRALRQQCEVLVQWVQG